MFRILVADDDAIQLDLRKQVLEIGGYRVEIAFTAAQAIRRLQKSPADLVVLDLRFPNARGVHDPQEGLALIRGIRDLGLGIPLIVLSGWPQDLYGQPEEPLVSRILLKPVKTPELLHAIGELLA